MEATILIVAGALMGILVGLWLAIALGLAREAEHDPGCCHGPHSDPLDDGGPTEREVFEAFGVPWDTYRASQK